MSGAMSGARRATPRGQMTRGANSGPAVMLMPPHIRATFMPNPPLEQIPPKSHRRKHEWTGMTAYLQHFETTPPPERVALPTPDAVRELNKQRKKENMQKELEPKIEEYRKDQKACGGDFEGMNCYNTLFVGRMAYEVTERKLLREMETFGPVKDIKIVKDKKEGKSRGYAFVEYDHEEDMKRAYRAADGMRIEGREIVADVERGHTVPSWLPRRLGGGLGGTRLGGRDMNVTRPGRFDPARPDASVPAAPMDGMGMGRGNGPPAHYGFGGPPQGHGPGRGGFRDGPPPPRGPPYGQQGRGGNFGGGDRYGGPPHGGPPPSRDWDQRKRQRSRSPERRFSGDRRRRY
jgi:U1 small nuclear ribonucleoprotein